MRVKVIESLSELGGQLTALYPEKYLYDVPGFPKIGAKDLVASLVEQMSQYNPTIEVETQIVNLQVHEDLGLVIMEAEDGKHHYAKTVIIAAGSGAFTPRKPKLAQIDKFEGAGVHFSVRNKAQFEGKRLVIAGGGDSAFDWARDLGENAESITLIHRSDKFRAHEDTIEKVIDSGNVEILTYHELKALHGSGSLEKVTIYNNKTLAEKTLEVDDLLITMGFVSSIGPIAQWGFELSGNSIIVNEKMETTLPYVYAVGDIVTYPGKLKLIVSGFSDAATAVNYAKAAIDPSAKVFPGHSSNQSH
jgi:thioredoxin reductase (NADPH)